jgi:hypothetical protein
MRKIDHNYGLYINNEYLFILVMCNWLEGTPITSGLYNRLVNIFSLHFIDYATKAFKGLMRVINQNSRNVFYLYHKQCIKINNHKMAVIHLIAFIQDEGYQNAESLINDIITIDGKNDLIDTASKLV